MREKQQTSSFDTSYVMNKLLRPIARLFRGKKKIELLDEVCLLKHQIDKLTEKIDLLQNLNVNLKREAEEKKRDVEKKYSSRIVNLENTCNTWELKYKSQLSITQSLQVKYEKSKRRYIEAEAEVHTLRQKVDKYEKERNEDRLFKDSKQVKKLKKQLQTVELELEFKKKELQSALGEKLFGYL